jgi:hypothetical protein
MARCLPKNRALQCFQNKNPGSDKGSASVKKLFSCLAAVLLSAGLAATASAQ